MEIYRYPKTNKDALELTDSLNLKDKIQINYSKAVLDCDITIDKRAERQSRISIVLTKEDLKTLHFKYLEMLEMETTKVREQNMKLKSQSSFEHKAWRNINSKISYLKYGQISQNNFLDECEKISESIILDEHDNLSKINFISYPISLKDLINDKKIVSVDSAIKHLLNLYQEYTYEFEEYFNNLLIDNHLPFIQGTKLKGILYNELTSIINSTDALRESISSHELFQIIFNYYTKAFSQNE